MSERALQAPVSGSCLCGAVRFEARPPTLVSAHCHCTLCRRSHGAGFVTWFTLPKAQWRVTHGEQELRRYRSSDHGTRSFCGRCGSSLFFETRERPEQIDVTLASVHAQIDRTPQLHIFFDDRVPWLDLEDSLPKLGGPSGVEPL